LKEKTVCQRAIRAITSQEYECGLQIAHSKKIEACPLKKIEDISLTATNCSSYTVMINNPKGEDITETCRGDTKDQNVITGVSARGTILLKSDCTINVGKERLILGDGEKQRKVHWDDMFLTLNKIGPQDQIVLPLLTIAGVAGGGCGFFILTIIFVIIAGCRGWHLKLWKRMMSIRKCCQCNTCNCFRGSDAEGCGFSQKTRPEDVENPPESTRKTRTKRSAEQVAFFRTIREFLSQSWDNIYEPQTYQNEPRLERPLLPQAEKPLLGPKPSKPTEMTTINKKGANEGNKDFPKIIAASAPPPSKNLKEKL
jgi:hypothetical protein